MTPAITRSTTTRRNRKSRSQRRKKVAPADSPLGDVISLGSQDTFDTLRSPTGMTVGGSSEGSEYIPSTDRSSANTASSVQEMPKA